MLRHSSNRGGPLWSHAKVSHCLSWLFFALFFCSHRLLYETISSPWWSSPTWKPWVLQARPSSRGNGYHCISCSQKCRGKAQEVLIPMARAACVRPTTASLVLPWKWKLSFELVAVPQLTAFAQFVFSVTTHFFFPHAVLYKILDVSWCKLTSKHSSLKGRSLTLEKVKS